jgi:Ca2+-dependent lipid-binding protein
VLQVHVEAWIRLGPVSLYLPVKVEDVQLDAVARITLRPLVDKLPCIGAISIALTESPLVDLTLKLLNDWDLMSLPFVHDLVLMGTKIGAEPV